MAENDANEKRFYLTRYVLIIKRLESFSATYFQLQDYLLNSFEFQSAGIKNYSIRILQRDIREISDFFNLSVHNKKKGKNRYYIEIHPIMQVDEYNPKLLKIFSGNQCYEYSSRFCRFYFLKIERPSEIGNS